MGVPSLPKWNGPLGKWRLPVSTLAVKGMAYDVVLRMMKEPVRFKKAMELPNGMAPSPVATTATRISMTSLPGYPGFETYRRILWPGRGS